MVIILIFKILFRTFIFYFIILISYKLMGKREVGELGIFDFVISMLMSQIVAISIENYKDPILYAFFPVILLVFLQIILSKLSVKNKKIRKFVEGKESIIIKNGVLSIKEMIKQRYTIDDLLMQLRDKNIRTIEEVQYAVLETNGKLSVFKNDDKDNKIFPLPIIVDGCINYDNIRIINKDKNWVYKKLNEKKLKLEDVFYSFVKGNEVYIIKKN